MIKQWQSFRGLIPILKVLLVGKMLSNSLMCCGKTIPKGRSQLMWQTWLSHFQKLPQSHNLQQPPSWLADSHQHWGKTLDPQRNYSLLKAQVIVSIFYQGSIILLSSVHCFLRHNAISHLIAHRVNITFTCTRKPKIHVTRFTALFSLLWYREPNPQYLWRMSELFFFEDFITSGTARMSTALYWFSPPHPGSYWDDIDGFIECHACAKLCYTEARWVRGLHAERHIESQFPGQGSNTQPLYWKHGILMTGPPGKSMNLLLRRSFGCFSHTASRSHWCRCASSWAAYHTNPSSVLLRFHYSHSTWRWRDEISVSGPKIEENITQVSNAQHKKAQSCNYS